MCIRDRPCAESYGNNKGQGLNAPISQRVAFGYGAALNYLLGDFERVQHFGDTTVVCWAEGGESAYSDLWVTDTNRSDKVSDRDVQSAMADLAQGKEMCIRDSNEGYVAMGQIQMKLDIFRKLHIQMIRGMSIFRIFLDIRDKLHR